MPELFHNPLLSSAYLPPVEYFFVLANSSNATIEYCETFQKQTYRTRCNIYASQGLFTLQVPVNHSGRHVSPISETRIDYSKNWVHQHETAIISAYRSSPFFEYYWDDFKDILNSKVELLVDLNSMLTELLMKDLGICCNISHSQSFNITHDGDDFRKRIHPKWGRPNLMNEKGVVKPYYQIFSTRFGFLPNLSAIDLLFHEGPEAREFIKA